MPHCVQAPPRPEHLYPKVEKEKCDMLLKDKFRFTCKDEPAGTIFTVEKLYEGKYLVTWPDDQEGDFYSGEDIMYHFTKGDWVLLNGTTDITVNVNGQPIKSDGGSSTYYDLTVPPWLMDKLIERQTSTGQGSFIKTEECCEVFFGNDFDYSNQFKSAVRSYGTEKGGGKAGNSISYEQNKIKYSADKIIGLSERRKINQEINYNE